MRQPDARLLALLAGPALLVAIGIPGRTKIEPADMPTGVSALAHIRFLASDDLEGRGNGTAGLEKAAEYVASQFRRFGLRPAGDDQTYFQPFQVTVGGSLGSKNALRLEGAGGRPALQLQRDFEPMSFSGAGEVAAPLVFAGYGITAPEQGYDDYSHADVRGKAVLVLRHWPRENRSEGPFSERSPHVTLVTKTVNAKAHGAVAMLLVNDPLNHPGEEDKLIDFGEDLGASELGIPAVHVRRAVAESLFAGLGKDLARTQEAIDRDLGPASFELPGTKLDLAVDIARIRRPVRNVLGYLPPPGGDGQEELLVIGAHYDHLGLGQRHSASPQAKGSIHNGADDNASGTAGVLELARAFSARKNDLKRGILFAAFAGEELGLLGSGHYVARPSLPLEKTVAMLNLDMIGRLRDGKLYVGGIGSSPVFKEKLEELGAAESLSTSFSFSGYGSSDHTSFTRKGVPALFFFSGLHGDYHKPSDDWDKIEPGGTERVLRVAYGMADYLQALPVRPPFVREAEAEPSSGSGGRGYGAYFGSVPDFGYEGKGVLFGDVREGSPAAKAGLTAGDVLVEFDGRPIENLYDFTDALRRHKPGDEVQVAVSRDGERIAVPVILGRRP